MPDPTHASKPRGKTSMVLGGSLLVVATALAFGAYRLLMSTHDTPGISVVMLVGCAACMTGGMGVLALIFGSSRWAADTERAARHR
jgi:hypothetical protein